MHKRLSMETYSDRWHAVLETELAVAGIDAVVTSQWFMGALFSKWQGLNFDIALADDADYAAAEAVVANMDFPQHKIVIRKTLTFIDP